MLWDIFKFTSFLCNQERILALNNTKTIESQFLGYFAHNGLLLFYGSEIKIWKLDLEDDNISFRIMRLKDIFELMVECSAKEHWYVSLKTFFSAYLCTILFHKNCSSVFRNEFVNVGFLKLVLVGGYLQGCKLWHLYCIYLVLHLYCIYATIPYFADNCSYFMKMGVSVQYGENICILLAQFWTIRESILQI